MNNSNIIGIEIYYTTKALPPKSGRYLTYINGQDDPVFSDYEYGKGFLGDNADNVLIWAELPKLNIQGD